MKTKTLEITDKNFDKEIIQSLVPVLVAFGADWCGLCKTTDLMIEELASQYHGRLKVCKMDVDKTRKRIEFKLKGIPTFFMFKSGQKMAELIGLVPKDQLLQLVEDALK